jgi:hypothetical protein
MNGAKERITRALHDNGLLTFLGFLEFKRDGDRVAECEEGNVELKSAVVPKELEVPKAEAFSSGFARDGQVLTRAHSEKEGPPGQLMGGGIEWAIVIVGQLTENAWGEGLLGTGRQVTVFVALQLVR